MIKEDVYNVILVKLLNDSAKIISCHSFYSLNKAMQFTDELLKTLAIQNGKTIDELLKDATTIDSDTFFYDMIFDLKEKYQLSIVKSKDKL
jgi:hypothetical protein